MVRETLTFLLLLTVTIFLGVFTTMPRLRGTMDSNLTYVAAVRFVNKESRDPSENSQLLRKALEPKARSSLLSANPIDTSAHLRLLGLSLTGRFDEVITLLEGNLSDRRFPTAVSDAIAFAYLSKAMADAETDGKDSIEWLLHVRELRPGDLCANYGLWRQAKQNGDPSSALGYVSDLQKFSIAALNAADDRVLECTTSVVPYLLANDLWNSALTERVVAYLVWKHADQESVRDLLLSLRAQEPDNLQWILKMGELYQRRSAFAESVDAFEQALHRGSSNPHIYLSLGQLMLAQAGMETEPTESVTRQAWKWLKRYLELAPEDLDGIRLALEISSSLGLPEASELGSRLQDRLDHAVSATSDPQGVGPNLVMNPEFAIWEGNALKNWSHGTYAGMDGTSGLYAIAADAVLTGESGIRLLAIRGGRLDDGTTTYAELTGDPFTTQNLQYLVTVEYAASDFQDGSGMLMISDFKHFQPFVLIQEALPDTGDQWRRLTFVADGPRSMTAVRPLVRNLGDGDLRIRLLEVRPLQEID